MSQIPARTIDPTAPAYGKPSGSPGNRQQQLQEAIKVRQTTNPGKPGNSSGSSQQ